MYFLIVNIYMIIWCWTHKVDGLTWLMRFHARNRRALDTLCFSVQSRVQARQISAPILLLR